MKNIPISDIFEKIKDKNNYIFLETKRKAKGEDKSYLFLDPVDIISCKELSKIKSCLNSVDRRLKEGYFVAGYISYEAGFAFEDKLKIKKRFSFPLLWLGVYRKPICFDHKKVIFSSRDFKDSCKIDDIKPNITKSKYIHSIKNIKRFIEKGDTYQVNYTFKLNFSHTGSVFGLYDNLRKKQSVSYGCLMHFDDDYLLSFSPELFFRKTKSKISVRPMKGTINRGRFAQEDTANRKALNLSPKDRSENIMIVDLLRNDLGRISKIDTVKTKRLFSIEDYESLLQMTSDINGNIPKGLSTHDLFKAIFPSGSVTGAPKIRTMQIINEIEKTPRKIYTGSIGFITPKRNAVFNVAIRTLLINKKSNKGEMGIGSGVIYDSDPEREYRECKLKAKFLTEKASSFQLIETMLFKNGKECSLLEFHLERLSESAAYFNFLFNKKAILKSLDNERQRLKEGKDYCARLLLDSDGTVTISSTEINPKKRPGKITFSSKKVSSGSKFLFHKTTNRKLHDSEYRKYSKQDFFDAIFQNEKKEITEGAISNIFIKKGNRYYTPPIECGLLNGVYRRHLMKNKRISIEEKVLRKKDIESADEIFLTNAVRGITKVRLIKNG